MKYEVQTNFGRGNWENVWHDGEELAYFASPEEAQAEIDDMIEEMELQGMDYDRDDYMIVQVVDVKTITDNGKKWNVTFDGETLKFYDATNLQDPDGVGSYAFTEHGQFVSSYWLTTFTEGDWKRERGRGLNLNGGVPDWTLTGKSMDEIIDWAEGKQS